MAAKYEKKNKSPFWVRVSELSSRPVRRKRGMNLSRLSKLAKAGQTVVVADKLLGTGKLMHALTIAAFSCSQSAKLKVTKAGAKLVSVEELKAKNPTGKDVIILV